MSLARVKVWNPGDVLTAADLNSEFNNVLNNPISLISPSTGAINFGLQAHTGLVPTAITATSGTAGNVLAISSGAGVVGWGTVPLANGLTTATPAAGALFYVTTSGVLLPLAIGTSGQVLTVSTAPLPSWATPASAAAAAFVDPSTGMQFYEDFFGSNTTGVGSQGLFIFDYPWGALFNAGGLALQPTDLPGKGWVRMTAQGGGAASIASGTTGNTGNGPQPNFFATGKPTLQVGYQTATSGATGAQVFVGLSTGVLLTTATAQSAIYFWSSDPTAGVKLVSVNGGTQTVTSSLGVSTTAPHAYKAVISSSQIDVYVDGVLTTSITTNIPSAGLGLAASVGSSVTSGGFSLDYMSVVSSVRF